MTATEYNACVDQQADGVYRFALKHLRDEERAKDVVQESFLRMWTKLDTIDGTKAKSYLFTTAHHLIIDDVRKNARNTRMAEVHENLHHSGQDAPDLGEVLELGLSRLPEIQRSVILLRDLEGYSYEEIAELTGLNMSQVKVYIYRGRTALKEFIGSMEAVV